MRFSEKIKKLSDNFNIVRDLNFSNMIFKIIPALNRDEEPGYNPKQLDFTLKSLKLIDDQTLIFQMKYFNPE